MKINNNKLKQALIGIPLLVAMISGSIYALLFVCFSPAIGIFPESSFRLSPNSRLPKWFEVSSGYQRKDLTVEISYYAPPPVIFKNNFKAVLLGPPPDYRQLSKVIGISDRLEKKEINGTTPYYPSYNVATIKNITELIEHKRMEPIFYISDDPELKKAIEKN